MIVLSVIGLESDLAMVASDKVLIDKLEAIEKLRSNSKA
ncbi:hypothetical protein VHA01S_078_00010 [Vibrio halioticoli NBRC 102217]|uniref:Uncharacterized protein n=2 Tax=Vibrio halioticoli TaxID=71388 RepID=V5FRF8_9VIBR|nr:hypothetical protein VHA01S_078_00010 [Vibrio halioticoli NBRC 102217]